MYLAGFWTPIQPSEILLSLWKALHKQGKRHSWRGDPQLWHTIAQTWGGFIPLVLNFLSHSAFHLTSSWSRDWVLSTWASVPWPAATCQEDSEKHQSSKNEWWVSPQAISVPTTGAEGIILLPPTLHHTACSQDSLYLLPSVKGLPWSGWWEKLCLYCWN